MLMTTILFIATVLITPLNGRTFLARETDSLTVMRDQCAKNPYADECTRVKTQMEDLLRKCTEMASPVAACYDVQSKYCFIWPRELICYAYGGGSQVTQRPSSGSDSSWTTIPTDPNELRYRGDYCVSHQAEQKCQNLLSAIKNRYDECSKRPKTDTSCQRFKTDLCSAFPKFSPCLNSGSAKKRRLSTWEKLFLHQRKTLT